MHITPNMHYSNNNPIVTTITKTTVREFDADERCVKETVTEVTETKQYPYQNTWYSTSGNALSASIK